MSISIYNAEELQGGQELGKITKVTQVNDHLYQVDLDSGNLLLITDDVMEFLFAVYTTGHDMDREAFEQFVEAQS